MIKRIPAEGFAKDLSLDSREQNQTKNSIDLSSASPDRGRP
jgi:hypothetical protein